MEERSSQLFTCCTQLKQLRKERLKKKEKSNPDFKTPTSRIQDFGTFQNLVNSGILPSKIVSSGKKTSHEFVFFNWSEALPGCDGERQQVQHSIQEQLREKEEREANLIRQLRQTEEQRDNTRRELESCQEQLRGRDLKEANLLDQLREKEQELENSQRETTEMEQRLTNCQGQIREKDEEMSNKQQLLSTSEKQLSVKEQEVNELELSLTAAQQTLSQQRQQETCDWIISQNEIQVTDKCLGRGGWGSVNEGTYCGCRIAVKQIHELILSPHNRRLFEREMNIASRCRHPCLLQFIGATNDERSPLFVTEIMETSLRALLEQRELSETETTVISLDVARALNYLHQKKPSPIIHRDVSSGNVLLWRQGDQWRAKVSDYGTANVIKQTMTVSPGAPIYSSPEALSSSQTAMVSGINLLICLLIYLFKYALK